MTGFRPLLALTAGQEPKESWRHAATPVLFLPKRKVVQRESVREADLALHAALDVMCCTCIRDNGMV